MNAVLFQTVFLFVCVTFQINCHNLPRSDCSHVFVTSKRIILNSTFLVSCRDKDNCPHAWPWAVEGGYSAGVFLRDSSPYLREFWRKPRKKPNDLVDKRDSGLNPSPTVYQIKRRTPQPRLGLPSPDKTFGIERNIWGNKFQA